MKKLLYSLKKYPVAIGVLTIILCIASIENIDSGMESYMGNALLRVLLCIICGAAIFAISGSKTFENLDNDTGYVIKKCSGFMIFALVIGSLSVVANLYKKTGFVDNLPVKILVIICLAISIGLFEEMCFRVVINDALLYQFRNNKHIFIWIALISSVFFGFVHVMGTKPDSALVIAQIVLKILTTGLLGFGFLILYWKTRNFWAIGLAHGLYDLFGMFSQEIFVLDSNIGDYVVDETIEAEGVTMNTGYFYIINYCLQLIVFIFIILFLIKVLKSIDFEKIREEW